MKQNSKVIHEKYEFRNIHKDEIEQAAEIESICFPPNEACTYEHMESRIKKASDLFLVVVDRETGKIAGFLLMRQFYMGIPKQLDEAAKIDGANHFQIFWKILLPNTKSSMTTLGIYTFISAWNNLIWMLLSVRSEGKWTVTLGISSICGASVIKQPTWNLIMGVIVIGMIPVLILFFAFQKYFMQSVAATGIK